MPVQARLDPDSELPEGSKLITFMRHGEGEHNVARRQWDEGGLDGVPYDLEHDPEFR